MTEYGNIHRLIYYYHVHDVYERGISTMYFIKYFNCVSVYWLVLEFFFSKNANVQHSNDMQRLTSQRPRASRYVYCVYNFVDFESVRVRVRV